MNYPFALSALCFIFFFVFFFSSRRRHTRSKRDWSSDVCSSDLDPLRDPHPGIDVGEDLVGDRAGPLGEVLAGDGFAAALAEQHRSEERRVGKECRARWWP